MKVEEIRTSQAFPRGCGFKSHHSHRLFYYFHLFFFDLFIDKYQQMERLARVRPEVAVVDLCICKLGLLMEMAVFRQYVLPFFLSFIIF